MRVKNLILITLCLTIGLTGIGCKQINPELESVPEVKEVEIMEVFQEKDVNESLFSGTLQALDETGVSFEVSGLIKAMHVDVGDQVNLDDNLAELVDESYSLQTSIADLNIEKATAAYEKNLADFVRYSELYDANAISLSEMEAISTQLTASEKDMQSAQVACELANLSLAKTRLNSPISGTLIAKLVSVGQIVNAGTPVFKIGNIERLKVVLQIPDYEISKWRVGSKIPVKFYGTIKQGTVSKIQPSVSQGTGTIGVEITIDNYQKDWYSGQLVTCTLETEEAGAIFVPVEAVISDRTDESYVFIIDGDTAVKTSITPGKLKNDRLEICSGLKPGDKVVVKGADRLFDRDKVQIFQEVEF